MSRTKAEPRTTSAPFGCSLSNKSVTPPSLTATDVREVGFLTRREPRANSWSSSIGANPSVSQVEYVVVSCVFITIGPYHATGFILAVPMRPWRAPP
jgi:hypothetical protein